MMNKEIDFIREHVPTDDLLLRLESACFRMGFAAQMLRSAIKYDKLLPVSEDRARENLMDSIAEVSFWLRVLGSDHANRAFCLKITRAVNEKARRWAGRLRSEQYQEVVM